MTYSLEHRIGQIYDALSDIKTHDLSSIKHTITATSHYVSFSEGITSEKLNNKAELIVANIACIKDHFKNWCKENSKDFNVENFVNENFSVALIHDLWNVNKHVNLDKFPPRSGHIPKLQNLKRTARLTAALNQPSFIGISNGSFITSRGISQPELVISGQIVDENGLVLGDFIDICLKAIEAWESALRQQGIIIKSQKN